MAQGCDCPRMKMLIVQTAFLGDAVLSSPVVAALATRFPTAERWLMVTPAAAQLYRNDPRLSGVFSFDKHGRSKGFLGMLAQIRTLRAHKFDIVYSLHRSFRTSFLLWASGIPRRVGFKDASGSWFYTERRSPLKNKKESHAVERHFALIADHEVSGSSPPELELTAPTVAEVTPVVRGIVEGRGYTALFPGSVWATKRWWSNHYRSLIELLEKRGEGCVVLGSEGERALCEEVSRGTNAVLMAGVATIPETMLMVKHASRVVCNDSMALHLASTFKVPSVSIFCATVPSFGFGPWRNPRAKVVGKEGLSCRPCARHGGNSCPTGTQACMREVLPGDVLNACDEVGVR